MSQEASARQASSVNEWLPEYRATVAEISSSLTHPNTKDIPCDAVDTEVFERLLKAPPTLGVNMANHFAIAASLCEDQLELVFSRLNDASQIMHLQTPTFVLLLTSPHVSKRHKLYILDELLPQRSKEVQDGILRKCKFSGKVTDPYLLAIIESSIK